MQPSPARLRLQLALSALLPVGLLVQAAAAGRPDLVERLFSRGVYPSLGGGLGCLTEAIPFSLAEALVATASVFVAHRVVRSVGRLRRGEARWAHALAAGASSIGASAGIAYAVFLVVWGLHYQRQPFGVTAGLDTRPARVAELLAVARELVDAANDLREGLPEDARGVLRLPDGPAATLARTDAGFRAAAALHPTLVGRCARPKPAASSVLLSYLGISGIYVPFTGEPHVNASLPEAELPFAAAHEVAHQRGFAREDEANYLGYAACRLHPEPAFRYSGALAASLYATAALRGVDRDASRALDERRTPAVRRDLDAIAAWSARHRGPALEIARRVTDAYLRSQGQREGVRSYGRMVDLLIAERRAAIAATPRSGG